MRGPSCTIFSARSTAMSSLMLLRGNNTAARHQGAIDLLLLKFWGPHYSLPSSSHGFIQQPTIPPVNSGREEVVLKISFLQIRRTHLVFPVLFPFFGLLLCTLAICFHAQISENLVTEKSSSKHRTTLHREKHEMPPKKVLWVEPPHDFKRLRLITSEPST